MTAEREFDDHFFEVVDTLINVLRLLEWCGRYLGPQTPEKVSDRLQEVHTLLERVADLLDGEDWPVNVESFRQSLEELVKESIVRLTAWHENSRTSQDMGTAYRILGVRPLLCEQLFPLAKHFSHVHRYFLDEQYQDLPIFKPVQEDAEINAGVTHVNNDRQSKGGFSLYVPETYDSSKRYPVVCALHGGSGHGARFLWSWLRTARSEQLILISPTCLGPTWALMGPDVDSPNLHRILDDVSRVVNIDTERVLMTGMSDGGTFTYVSGCMDSSPFTHLAPCSASFHPMLIEMFSKQRLQGLPICITHGELDWMFTVDIAQTAEYAFTAAGANVLYREIADLAHTYPEEANPELVEWFLNTNP